MEQPNRPPTLPNEIQGKIFSGLNVVDKVTSGSVVCYDWFNFCKQPSLWKVLDMRENPPTLANDQVIEMCKYAVTKSEGQLQEVYIDNFATNDLLEFIVDSSPSLKVLYLHNCHEVSEEVLRETVPRIKSLENLSLSMQMMFGSTIDLIGSSCPNLSSFSIHIDNYNVFDGFNPHAFAIGRSMTRLRSLKISTTGNLTNAGVEEILNGCPTLVSLDIENCVNLVLTEYMSDKCSSRFSILKLPPNPYDDIDVNWDDITHYGDYYWD